MLITEIIKIQETSVLNTVNDLKFKKKKVLTQKLQTKKTLLRKLF